MRCFFFSRFGWYCEMIVIAIQNIIHSFFEELNVNFRRFYCSFMTLMTCALQSQISLVQSIDQTTRNIFIGKFWTVYRWHVNQTCPLYAKPNHTFQSHLMIVWFVPKTISLIWWTCFFGWFLVAVEIVKCPTTPHKSFHAKITGLVRVNEGLYRSWCWEVGMHCSLP